MAIAQSRMAPAGALAAQVDCPYCGAKVGQRCWTAKGARLAEYHKGRYTRARTPTPAKGTGTGTGTAAAAATRVHGYTGTRATAGQAALLCDYLLPPPPPAPAPAPQQPQQPQQAQDDAPELGWLAPDWDGVYAPAPPPAV